MSKTYADFLNNLAARESGGNYTIVNNYGYVGKYQMGELALIDAGYYLKDGTARNDWSGQWTGRDDINSFADFRNSPTAQENAIRAYVDVQWGYIKNFKLDQYVGSTIGGIEITESGLIAGAHLMGVGGLKTYLRSDGEIIPRDGTKPVGTPITEYIDKFKGYTISGNAAGDDVDKSIATIAPNNQSNFQSFSDGIDSVLDEVDGWAINLKRQIYDWLAAEINDTMSSLSSSAKTSNVGTASTGTKTTIRGVSSQLTIDNISGTVKIPTKTGNIGSTFGEIGMFTTYDMRTGNVLELNADYTENTWIVGINATIDLIAAATGSTREQLQAANPGKDLSNLKDGDTVNLPTIQNGLVTNQPLSSLDTLYDPNDTSGLLNTTPNVNSIVNQLAQMRLVSNIWWQDQVVVFLYLFTKTLRTRSLITT